MRILFGVMVLALSACAGGAPPQDTPSDSAGVASADQRERAMTGAAVADSSLAAGSDAVPHVLLIGTSLTAGLGLDPSDAYPSVLQRMADSAGYMVRVVNAGLSGETSAGALRRLDWLLRGEAALVMVETGANDGLRGLDVDSTRANLLAVVRKVKARYPGAPVLLVQMEAPPNLGADYTQRFRDAFVEVARVEGIELVPFLLEGIAGVRRLNQGDGIHPNEEGAELVARNIWPSLAPHLAALRVARVLGPG